MTIQELEDKYNISRYFNIEHTRDEDNLIENSYIVLNEYASHIELPVIEGDLNE